MKHLAKDIYLESPDQYNFVLVRKWHATDKKGEFIVDDNGSIKELESPLGYFSNFERVWSKITELGWREFINGDINECKKFMDEASNNFKKYMDDNR